MTLTTVILLIIIGLLIILAEIFFVPGSTIVGVIGVALVMVGVVGAFYSLGSRTGWIVFGSTLAVLAVLTYLGFRTRTWQRFAVKSSIDSKVPVDSDRFNVGQQGITLTRCTPIGKVQFENGVEEVYSANDYIDAGTEIVIVRIHDHKIIVKPLIPAV
jgi:membrane-bound ClpP family serine protease